MKSTCLCEQSLCTLRLMAGRHVIHNAYCLCCMLCYLRCRRYDNACSMFVAALLYAPRSRCSSTCRLVAACHLATGRVERALQYLDLAEQHEPGRWGSSFLLSGLVAKCCSTMDTSVLKLVCLHLCVCVCVHAALHREHSDACSIWVQPQRKHGNPSKEMLWALVTLSRTSSCCTPFLPLIILFSSSSPGTALVGLLKLKVMMQAGSWAQAQEQLEALVQAADFHDQHLQVSSLVCVLFAFDCQGQFTSLPFS